MSTVPISFVAALLMVILLARLWRSGQGETPLPFLILLGACALSSVVVGLRWGFQVRWALGLQPVLASSLPPLSWVAVLSMLGPLQWRHWVHASGVVVVACLSLFWREPLDLVLIVLNLGYAIALIRVARLSADRLEQVRLGDVGSAQRAVFWLGWMWVASALVEAIIGLDFAMRGGRDAMTVVTVATTLQLLVLGWIVAFLGRSQSQPKATASEAPAARALPHLEAGGGAMLAPLPEAGGEVHQQVLDAFHGLMTEQRLFLDVNLTLDRIARRLGIPARQISVAINAVHARNVSQVVNEYRVAEAQKLLASTSLPVTGVFLDAGFQTKSNFNREFRRVTGMSPSDYRARELRQAVSDGV